MMADGASQEAAEHPERAKPGAGSHKAGPFTISLFLVAALLFLPPIVTLAEGPETVFGLPRTFVFMFAAWIAVVAMAVSAAVAFARGRGTATLPLPTEDEDRRKGGVFGSCDGGGAAAALSGPRTKPDTALPRASRPGPAADQSCCT